jgi:hypothetical protein
MSMSFPPNGSLRDGASSGSRGALPPTGGARPGAGTTVALALDNMLRNQLRVSDPRNPRQIAEGLLSYYQDLPQTAGIKQEALGLPFLQTPTLPALAPRQPSSSDTEFNIANGDVEKALLDLSSNPLTNDITPEMQGWGDSIRTAITQGKAAAQMGLDPTQRDKVIAMRRQLGEYARMARFVGSLSPGMTQNFRRLGRGLDEVSSVMLVMLGESLASVGFATGYYLLQVPVQELQQRRDAVIYALRNFNGGTQQSYGPDDWPRGIDAYRRLYQWLEEQGQGDLRSLLLENEVAQTMDALITRAQNGTSEGLRALGVTAQLDIERFRRMAIVAPGAMANEFGHLDRSPPLEAYLQALELFAETFRPAGGLRLLRIARPSILLYGLYNVSQVEDDNALFDLIAVRGALASIFDGLFGSGSARGVKSQVLLDMLLTVLDRGIDLLALGSGAKEGGPTDWRAIAYWAVARVIVNVLLGQYLAPPAPTPTPPAWWINANSAPNPKPLPLDGPILHYATAHPWFNNELIQINGEFLTEAAQTLGFSAPFKRYQLIPLTTVTPLRTAPKQLAPTPHVEKKIKSVTEELRVQLSLEDRWENLVRTLCVDAGDQSSVFPLLKKVIEQAAYDVLRVDLQMRIAMPLPPQFEQTLVAIAKNA